MNKARHAGSNGHKRNYLKCWKHHDANKLIKYNVCILHGYQPHCQIQNQCQQTGICKKGEKVVSCIHLVKNMNYGKDKESKLS